MVQVNEGDVMSITGRGASAPRLWAFTDTNYVLVSHADVGAQITTKTDFIAPCDGYFIFNAVTSFSYSIEKSYDKGTYLELIESLASMSESIPSVINNLTDGGTTDALSAEMGKDLNEKLSVLIGDDGKVIDFSKQPSNAGCLLTSNNTFSFYSQYYSHYVVQVNAGATYYLTANQNYATIYALVKTYTKPTQTGDVPDFCEGCHVVQQNPSAGEVAITMPDDCNYIIINHMGDQTMDRTPSSFYRGAVEGIIQELQKIHLPCFSEIDLSFDFSNTATSCTSLTKLGTCSDLLALWDSLIATTGYGVKSDTTIDTLLSTPSEQPNPIYIYKFLCNKARIDNSRHIKVLIFAGEHANEWSACYILLEMMKEICGNWATDRNCELLLSLVDWYVIPCLNPWGYNNSDRLNYNGVNINRNYDASNWKEGVAGNDYGGVSAASEFETQTIQWYVNNIKPDVFMDIHAGGTNVYGSIGSIECSINDEEYEKLDYYGMFSKIARTSSNRFILDNDNYPQTLNRALIDANLQLQSTIIEEGTSSVYTGLSHQYAMQNGVPVSMLIELCATSAWNNGSYDTSSQETVSGSAVLVRDNVLFLMNAVYRAIKAISDSYLGD